MKLRWLAKTCREFISAYRETGDEHLRQEALYLRRFLRAHGVKHRFGALGWDDEKSAYVPGRKRGLRARTE